MKNRIEETRLLLENMDLKDKDKLIQNFIVYITVYTKNYIKILVKFNLEFEYKDGKIILPDVLKHSSFSDCSTYCNKQNIVPIFYFYIPLYDNTQAKIETFLMI